MNRKEKFFELAKHFGIDDPDYRESIVGMCSTMDERVWKKAADNPVADDFGMQTGLQISREIYLKYFKARHKEDWSLIHELTDAKLYLHSCGAVSELIPDLIDCGLNEQRLLPFGTPAHVLQPDQPLENIFAMMNAAVKYGRYPVRND